MTGPTTYVHGEAFRLMVYESKDGAERLTIWNSRDGVTPFGTEHPVTGTELLHVRWADDVLAPHHVPSEGDWIWVDTHQEEMVRRFREGAVELWWNDEKMPMREHPHLNPSGEDTEQAKMAAALRLAEGCEPGSPMLVQVTGPLRDQFVQASTRG